MEHMIDEAVETEKPIDMSIQTDPLSEQQKFELGYKKNQTTSTHHKSQPRPVIPLKTSKQTRRMYNEAFFGEKSFQAMQGLSAKDLQEYLAMAKRVTLPKHLPWMREYEKYLNDTKQRSQDYKVYKKDVNGEMVIDITATLAKQREMAWW